MSKNSDDKESKGILLELILDIIEIILDIVDIFT